MAISKVDADYDGDSKTSSSTSGSVATDASHDVDAYLAPYNSTIDATIRELLNLNTVSSTLEEYNIGTWEVFLREWQRNFGDQNSETLQSLLFKNGRKEQFLIVAPSITWLLFLNAFMGIDVEGMLGDTLLWKYFLTSLRQKPTMTELERVVFLVDAPRLGFLNPIWRTESSGTTTSVPDWKTRYFDNNVERSSLYLNSEALYWELRTIKVGGISIPWAYVFDAAEVMTSDRKSSAFEDSLSRIKSPVAEVKPSIIGSTGSQVENVERTDLDLEDVSRRQNLSGSELKRRNHEESSSVDAAIPLPNFDEPLGFDEEKTLIVRVATGKVELEEWERLRPGDLLTTEASAESLFEAIVDDVVLFHVRPGLYKGGAAIQIKECLNHPSAIQKNYF